MVEPPFSVIYAGEAPAALLRNAVPRPYVCVRDRAELAFQTSQPGAAAAFVDAALLPQLEGERLRVPIVAVSEDDQSQILSTTIRLFTERPWLSHVIATRMLTLPTARHHLSNLVERLAHGTEQSVLGPHGVGRVAKIMRASRREARFERVHEFFESHGLSSRALSAIGEVAEELVMNALYDAPFEAGHFKKAVSRTEDVELPPNRACEISYGIEHNNAFIRVRDSFGSLSRTRMMEVLNRCNSKSVEVDPSRGGAGLGMWRIFSIATTLAITVIPGQVTDILIGMTTKDGRLVRDLGATHLFFAQPNRSRDELIPEHDTLDQSITLVGVIHA